VNLAALTPEQWAEAKFQAAVSSVVISSPPVVEFTIADNVGNPVIGFETLTSKRNGDKLATYPNLSFAIAKLEPRTDAKPSSWVSYMVTSVNTTTEAVTLGRPGTDNIGKLEAVTGKPGTYKYTFYRDIPGIKAQVDGITPPANSSTAFYDKADLGDLTFATGLPHRLTIQISGAAPGTGTNTPNGVAVAPTVNMANPVNVTYDFKPGAAGAPGTPIPLSDLTREDVNIDTCNVCHGKLAFHGGSGRVDVRYCVVCHTNQRAFGAVRSTSTRDPVTGVPKFATLNEKAYVNPATGITSYYYSKSTSDPSAASYHPSGTDPTYVADGEVSGNFNTMIHKIHNGKELVKENYNYANLVFDKKGFSKLGGGQRMCTTCHDSKVAATADNYKKLPSRTACGACHDGILWATGGGSTLADKALNDDPSDPPMRTSGHGGRDQADDSKCALCHTPTNVPIDHRMENLTKNNKYVIPGLATFTYEIESAAVNATSNDVTIKFRIQQQVADSTGSVTNVAKTPVTLVAPAASVSAPLTGFSGSPSFLLAYAWPQDGITTTLADYNNWHLKQGQPISVSIAALLSTNNAATIGSLAGPDSSGFYTATILGNSATGTACGGNGTTTGPAVKCAFPPGAKLRTVALQGYFTQLNAPVDPANPATTGSVARHAISVLKTVTGDTPRRTVVAADKCASCHEWFEGHGGNRVYETQVCVMCHNPNLATSGRGISDATLTAYNTNTTPSSSLGVFTFDDRKILADWTFFSFTGTNQALKFPVTSNNFKDMIHGIHAGRERRVTPFQDARDRSPAAITLLDFRRMDFPGRLNNCETCHVTATTDQKTYDFVPAGALASTYESRDLAYQTGITGGTATTALAKTALNTRNDQDIVRTPFAAACSSCHDNSAAKAHIAIMGGQLDLARSVALPAVRALEDVESCAVCHGPGRDFDTSRVHNK
jgi:OmcA/MtrC family decaheme c-type cytochrome